MNAVYESHKFWGK